MKTYEDALKLSQLMVKIGELADRETVAYITDMDQPLGMAIGNAIEIIEAVETLKGSGHTDLLSLCLELASEMMFLADVEKDKTKALEKLNSNIKTGKALAKFKEIVANQGGNPKVLEDYSLLPTAQYELEVKAEKDIYVKSIDAIKLGLTAMKIGAGRQQKDDIIDPAVGVWLYKKVGDEVRHGETFAKILANDEGKLHWAFGEVKDSFEFSTEPVDKRKVIWAKISKDGVCEL